jgi:nitrogen fixation protein FixH
MKGRLWPVALVAVLALTVLANLAMWIVAADPNGSTVEPDYYRKALAWDRAQEQGAANRALGWKATARFGKGAGTASPSSLEVSLVDAAGRPLDGALIGVIGIHNALAAHPVALTLAPTSPGVYAGQAVFPRSGLWELRLTVRRERETFTADVRADAPVPARGAL